MKRLDDAPDVTITECGPDLTVVTVRWESYRTHLRFFLPPTQGEINEAVTVGRLRLDNIRRQIAAVTQRLSK